MLQHKKKRRGRKNDCKDSNNAGTHSADKTFVALYLLFIFGPGISVALGALISPWIGLAGLTLGRLL